MTDVKNATKTEKTTAPKKAFKGKPRRKVLPREDIFVDYINGTKEQIVEALSRKVGSKGYNARVRDLLVSAAIAMTWARDNSGSHVGPRILSGLLDMDTLHAILNRQHKDFVRIPDSEVIGIRHYLSGLSGYDPVQGTSQSGVTMSNHTFQERKAQEVLRGSRPNKARKPARGKVNRKDVKKVEKPEDKAPKVVTEVVVDRVNGFPIRKKTTIADAKVVGTTYQVVVAEDNIKDFGYLKEAREFAKEYKAEVA